ncbi:NAD-P-binding protein [Mycena polygramma]|nr:NAD-P-binding protein [Mycena polygramma]
MPQTPFSSTTTAEEVATAFADEIRGKNVLITGTSLNGLGFETARVLAKHANLVVITGHNFDRLKLAEDAIRSEVPSANIRPLILDLSSMAGVRKAAAEVQLYPEPLHVIIHNAAATVEHFKLTVDNLESQMATNHVGPFLLTKLLVPKLLATRTAQYTPRVVFVSALGHGFCDGVNFSTLEKPDAESYESLNTYFQTKCTNILMAIELSKRSRGQINAYSLHPGVIFTNLMQKGVAASHGKEMGMLGADGLPTENSKFPFKTIPQGAATTVVAAFDPALNDKPGAYLSDCIVTNEAIAPHCADPANAEKLWAVTEGIIGETFVF